MASELVVELVVFRNHDAIPDVASDEPRRRRMGNFMNAKGLVVFTGVLAVAIANEAGSSGPNEGACCLGNGNCLELTGAQCGLIPNTVFAGGGSDCRDIDGFGVAEVCHQSQPTFYFQFLRSATSEIVRWSPGEEEPRLALATEVYPEFLFHDPLTERLYFSRYRSLYCSSMDGTSFREIVMEPTELQGVIDWMMPDSRERLIYWRIGNTLRRCRFGGSEVETLRTEPFSNTATGARFLRILSLSSAHSCVGLPMDADFDQDVDLTDFARFQNCLSEGGR